MRGREQDLAEAAEKEMRDMAAERDEKVSALTDQAAEAERSGLKHEATMLLQQARFFGQRMDSKIATTHADAEKAKQERAEEHQRFKASERAAYDEERAKEQARDEQQQSSGLLHEMLDARAGAVEDAWARNLTKDLGFRIDQLRSATFEEFARTHHVAADFSSVDGVAEALDKLVAQRIAARQQTSDQGRMQTLTQIKGSVEKFASGKTTSDDMAQQIETVLLMTQHRQMREVLRWQYEEVLLCLTFCARAAAQLAAGAGE